MNDIKSISQDDLTLFLITHGDRKSRVKRILEYLWKEGISSFKEMIDVPIETRKLLQDHFSFNTVSIDIIKESSDKTIKVAVRLNDGSAIESVLIPSKQRTTACISTQVCCALACSFCATGTLGLTRNLSFIEIYDQALVLNRLSIDKFGHPLNNIVMMGMGEPLMNYNNVMKSIEYLTASWGLALSHNRITVSTAGVTEKIKQLADDGFICNLAISLHSADVVTRDSLMNINKSNNLADLSNAISYFYDKTKKKVTFEYLLLQGINDSIADAENLVNFCKSFPCKINIISYNETEQSIFKKTSHEQSQLFVSYLISQKMIVTLRASKGQDIEAACGQLANKRNR